MPSRTNCPKEATSKWRMIRMHKGQRHPKKLTKSQQMHRFQAFKSTVKKLLVSPRLGRNWHRRSWIYPTVFFSAHSSSGLSSPGKNCARSAIPAQSKQHANTGKRGCLWCWLQHAGCCPGGYEWLPWPRLAPSCGSLGRSSKWLAWRRLSAPFSCYLTYQRTFEPHLCCFDGRSFFTALESHWSVWICCCYGVPGCCLQK